MNEIKINEINENIIDKFEMPYENDEYTKYNPLHNELGIKLNKNIEYIKKITYNKYEIIDNGVKKECFKKFITLNFLDFQYLYIF